MPEKIYRLNTAVPQAPISHYKIAAAKIEFQRPYRVNLEDGSPDPVAGFIQVWTVKTRDDSGAKSELVLLPGGYVELSGAAYNNVKTHLDALESALYTELVAVGALPAGVLENA